MKIKNPYLCDRCNRIVNIYSKPDNILYKICSRCGEYKYRSIILKGKEAMIMVQEHKWIDITGLAKLVKRSVAMVRYWVANGAIPYHKLNGHVMFMDTDLRAIVMFVKLNERKRGVKTGSKMEVSADGKQDKDDSEGTRKDKKG